MSLLAATPAEQPGERLQRLPDGRCRLTILEDLNLGLRVNDSALIPNGTIIDRALTDKYTLGADLRLFDLDFPVINGSPYRRRIYETLSETGETLVGRARVLRGDDGRTTVEQDWLQFSAARATPQKVGTTTCPTWPLALTGITGTAATDVLTLTGHGLLAGDRVRFTLLTGGAGLSTGTDYYVRDVTADTFKLAATSGGIALDFTTDITAATLLPQIVAVLASEAAPDDGTLRRITRRYVTDGLISIASRTRGGGLRDVTWVSVLNKLTPVGTVIADATNNTLGVGVHTVTAVQTLAGAAPGSSTYTYDARRKWRAPGRLKGAIIDKAVLSPGTIPSSFDYKILALNTAAPVVFENLPVTVSVSHKRIAPLTGITGAASTDVLTLAAHGLLDGDRVQFTALTGGTGLATLTDYYVRDAAADTFKLALTSGGTAINITTDITAATLMPQLIGTISPALWDPQGWCTVDWDLILRGPRPVRRVQDYPGYCVIADALTPGVSTSSVTTPASGVGYYIAGEGELLFQGGNVHTLTITGPEYPTGELRTLEIEPTPEFEGLDGSQWYRITQVTARMPTLPAMPTLA